MRIGDLQRLPSATFNALMDGIQSTRNNSRMTLILALKFIAANGVLMRLCSILPPRFWMEKLRSGKHQRSLDSEQSTPMASRILAGAIRTSGGRALAISSRQLAYSGTPSSSRFLAGFQGTNTSTRLFWISNIANAASARSSGQLVK